MPNRIITHKYMHNIRNLRKLTSIQIDAINDNLSSTDRLQILNCYNDMIVFF